jgi:hypothetical protein
VSKIISLKVPHRTKPLDLDSLRIEPATLTDTSRRPLRSRATEPFVLVTVKDLVRGVKAVTGKRGHGTAQGLVVWLYILHKTRIRERDPIVMANKTMRQWGVSPDAKMRALRQLESAGLVFVRWGRRRSPVVVVVK